MLVPIVAVLGLLVGSFLNVVIARVPEGLSIVSPRSRCPKCGHPIAWYDNIPVLSWVALGAKCRGCRAPISWRYPAIELLTTGLFLACLWRFHFTYGLAISLVLVSLLIALTFIDLDHWILPFSITLPGIGLGILLSVPLGWARVMDSAIGAGLGFVVFLAMEILGEKIFKKEALGGGDKYLLAMIGAFLTWRPLLGVIFLASLQGGVIGSVLLVVRGRAGPAPEQTSDDEAGGHEGSSDTAPHPDPLPLAGEGSGEGAEAGNEEEGEDDWEPGPTNIPFGPWLSIAALELLFFAPWIARLPGAFGLMLTGSY